MENNINHDAEISVLQQNTETLNHEKDASCSEALIVENDAAMAAIPPVAAESGGEESQEAPAETIVVQTEDAALDRSEEGTDPAEAEVAKEEEEPQIPVLPLPDPISDFRGSISAFCFSQQGKSHEKKDVPCQDRSSLRFLSDTVVVAAVADGVGSCALSDYGSDTAVTAGLDYLEQHLGEKLKTPGFVMDVAFMGKLLREMMQYAYDQVKQKAEEMEQMLYSMQSTLTIAVYDGKTLYFAHAGDDGIVALTRQGNYEMVTSRHKGDEASSVYPLQSCNTWQYGMVNDVVGFVMATDGVLDAFVCNQVENNRVYYPFVEPAFSAVLKNAEETAAACNDWFAYMQSPTYRATVTDDLSFVCIVNQDTIREAEKPVFDMDAWNKQSQEYASRRKAALYPPKNPDAQKNASPAVPENPAPAQPTTQGRTDETAQKPAPGNPSPAHNNAGQTGNRPTPRQTAPRAQKDGQQPQPPHTGSSRENLNDLREYGRKVFVGLGGIIVVSGEMLVDFASDAVQRAKDYIDDELENRSNRNSRQTTGSKGSGEGSNTEGA